MNRLVALALQRAEFLSSRERFTVVEAVAGNTGKAENRFLALSRSALSVLLGRRIQSPAWEPARLLEQAKRDRSYLNERAIRVVTFDDTEYPAELRAIYDPPLLLYVRGRTLSQLPRRVAIVGTRKPTAAAFAAAYRLGREAAAAGWPVVSGLAHGIDTAAHRGVVSRFGATIAVLGSGIDVIYPRGNRGLCRLIVERGGSVVSEYPPGLPPLAYRFPERNRIISGLCHDVIVVQAPKSSGALITAEYALDQGREVYVHTAGLSGVEGAGSAALRDDGAGALEALSSLQWWGAEQHQRYRAGATKETPVPVGRAMAEELALELDGGGG